MKEIDDRIQQALNVMIESGIIRSDSKQEEAKKLATDVLEGFFMAAVCWSTEQSSPLAAVRALDDWAKAKK